MKPKANHVAFPVARVVVMMAFLSSLFLVPAHLAFAAPESKKSPVVERTSIVDQTEARIKELQTGLKITDAQGKLWENLTQVMRENAKEMEAMIKNRAEAKSMNAVQRMQFHIQMIETHLNQAKKFLPPFEELYASMSDEQKKDADTLFHKGIMRKHGKHGKHAKK